MNVTKIIIFTKKNPTVVHDKMLSIFKVVVGHIVVKVSIAHKIILKIVKKTSPNYICSMTV